MFQGRKYKQIMDMKSFIASGTKVKDYELRVWQDKNRWLGIIAFPGQILYPYLDVASESEAQTEIMKIILSQERIEESEKEELRRSPPAWQKMTLAPLSR